MQMTSVGDNVVDLYRDTRMRYPGGGAANVSVQASRLGWTAHYVGVIGSDPAGDFVVEALRSEGVDLRGAIRSDEPNPVTEVSIDERGDRRFSGWRPPRRRIELSDPIRDVLAGSEWIYTNYSGGAEHLLPELAGMAPTAFDFSYKQAEYARPLLQHIDIAAFSRDALNVDEAVALARRVQDAGPETVIITRGGAGAVVARGTEIVVQPAVETDVIDTLGAGDAFLARCVCELMCATPLAEAALRAARTAAEVCGGLGAFGHGAPIDDDEDER